MSHDHRHPTHRSFAGWPALLAICILIAGVLYLTLGRNVPSVHVKPATGSAQAMALAAKPGGAQSENR